MPVGECVTRGTGLHRGAMLVAAARITKGPSFKSYHPSLLIAGSPLRNGRLEG